VIIHHTHLQHPLPRNPVVTVGTFDGVHRGHQTILRRLCDAARNVQGESLVLSFDPHPRAVLFPQDPSLKILQTVSEKAQRLEALGIDHLLVIPFTPEFAAMSYDRFVKEILVDRIGTHHLVVGYDHQFGKNREGSFTELRELGERYGFGVEEIPAHDIDQVAVSSTRIRKALLEGDVKAAATLLGYSYVFTGRVVQGRQLGRTLGFPTANLEVQGDRKLIPGRGVYAVTVKHLNNVHAGMMNIGVRPTVAGMLAETIEVHLLNFNGHLYNELLEITFMARVRDEVQFESLDALKNQLSRDKSTVSSILPL
jgi:riboflavin kinase/FMN adenylyltransferase